jgi:beta-glucosidase
MHGKGDWAESLRKATTMVSRMSLEEKVCAHLRNLYSATSGFTEPATQVNLTAGTTVSNGCSGNIPAIPSVNFPGMCLSDAGNGLRNTDFVSSWPSGIHAGAR